jgi:hypothetical protein
LVTDHNAIEPMRRSPRGMTTNIWWSLTPRSVSGDSARRSGRSSRSRLTRSSRTRRSSAAALAARPGCGNTVCCAPRQPRS